MTRKRSIPPGGSTSFIEAHSVFTLDEFKAHYESIGRDPKAARFALDYFLRERRLSSARRGLYTWNDWVDPWLVASKIAKDVVISHEGALSFHGFVGVGYRVTFMTSARVQPFPYRTVEYKPLLVSPGRLEATPQTRVEREGSLIRVATLEAALVDSLAELDHGPFPYDEDDPRIDLLVGVFKETQHAADPETMSKYAVSRGSPLLVSRLGFVLMCARAADLTDETITRLEKNKLPRPDYFRRTTRAGEGSLLSRWNLILNDAEWKHWRWSA